MNSSYRPEIDGLRALAVLPVIFFHGGIETFKGGYVGVDIFFVVSGYLITTVILKDIENKKFSLTYFYERRARRILPALITTIIFTIPFTLVLLPPSDLVNFSKSIISSLTFWSNFQFSNEAGYFATSGEYKPLLHTWSLSTEEQFYILYPLFFIFLFKVGKKFLVLAISFIIFLSIAFAQWSGNLNFQYPFIDEEFLFYSNSAWSEFMMPFGRIWELGFGAICAFLLNSSDFFINVEKNNWKTTFFNILSLIGIFLIFLSFFYLSRDFPYPSFHTLIPTIGACLLILFCQKDIFLQKILSYKVLVFIGLISYSMYLFHYPIFSLAKYAKTNFDNLFYIYLIPLVLFISFLNWQYVEKPFRKKNKPIKTLLIFISLTYVSLILFSFLIYKNDGLDKRKKFILPESVTESFLVSEKAKSCFDVNYIHLKENKDKICKIGKKNKRKIDFLIFGDSHILGFYEMFDKFGLGTNKKGLFVGYSGCPPLLNVYPIRADQKEKNCYKLNKLISELVDKEQIKNIILISRWSYYVGSNTFDRVVNLITSKPRRSSNIYESRKTFKKGLEETLEFYQKQGTKVFIFKEAPYQNINPKQIYYRSFVSNKKEFKRNLRNYSTTFDRHKKIQKFLDNIFNTSKNNFKNINLTNIEDFLCDDEKIKCLIGNEKYSFYVDKNHLSIKGVNSISDKIIEKLSLKN